MDGLNMKSTEQILREQVIELTRLLELKDQRIKELEALRTVPGNLIMPMQSPGWIFNPGPSCCGSSCGENCSLNKG
jgi:hypothetical protein